MRSPEEFSDTQIERISGDYVEFRLQHPRRLNKWLTERDGYRTLYHATEDALPHPLQDFLVDYYKDDHR